MWKKIGEVAVDTGQIWIIDPVYIDEVSSNLEEGTNKLIHFNGTELGAVIGTGAGDGLYDIMAKYDSTGVVAAIRIDFLDFESHGIRDSLYQD